MELNEDNKQRKETNFMGFSLAKSVADKVSQMALSMGQSEEAQEVPGLKGQVLVRQGSRAHDERKENSKILMIPVSLITIVNGENIEQTFYLCTK